MASKADEQNLNPPVSDETDYEQLIDDYTHFAPPHDGELLQGRVVKLHDKDVIVDFGYKSEGLVPIEQFAQPDGSIHVQVGDQIDVMVDRQGLQPEGYILLSHQKASRLRSWENLEKAHRDGLVVSGRVTGRIKGGLSVDVGVPAFMPGSQIDTRPTHNLDSLLGQDIPVKIVKLNRRRGNVVVSRKMAVEEEQHSRKSAALQVLEEGAVVTGVVKNLTDYGAFIDLGGIDGLLHVSDMSYGRVNHPSEVVTAGDEITVKVLKFDREKERISLGLRQLVPDPWETISERYPQGARVIGRVVSVTDYGAFVELEPGVEGLIHISEMTWSRRMKHPSKVVKVGDQVESVVLDVKPRDRRVSLGIKQLEADPWTTVADRYSPGFGGGRPGAQADRFRRVHRDRRRHRRAGAYFRSVLDQAREASFRSGEEGPVGAGRDSANRRAQPPAVAGRKAIAAGCLGIVLPRASGGRRGARASVPGREFRGVRGVGSGSGRLMPPLGDSRHIGAPARRIAAADRRGNGFQGGAAERSREEDRAERSRAVRRRRANPAGGLSAPRRRCHHDHRRSNEHQSKG